MLSLFQRLPASRVPVRGPYLSAGNLVAYYRRHWWKVPTVFDAGI